MILATEVLISSIPLMPTYALGRLYSLSIWFLRDTFSSIYAFQYLNRLLYVFAATVSLPDFFLQTRKIVGNRKWIDVSGFAVLLTTVQLHGGDTVSVDRGKMNTNSFSTFLFVFHVLLIHYFVYKRHHHWNRMKRNNNDSYLLHMHMYTKIYPGNSIVQKFLFITQKNTSIFP